MKKSSLKENIYYVGFGMAVLFRSLQSSTLFSAIPDSVFDSIYLLSAAIFLVKYILDNHSGKELVGVLISSILIVYLYIRGLPSFMVITFLGFVSIRDVDIKKIIKIDLIIKATFLLLHIALFSLDCVLDPNATETAFFSLTKGTANGLYFKNPNTAGIFGVWAIIDYLYLKQNKKIKTYIVPTILMVLIFAITFSRSAIVIYVLYLVLRPIRRNKLIYLLCKLIYPLMFLVSVFIILYVPMDSNAMIEINKASSWRISNSIAAFRTFGVNILPISPPEDFLEINVVDNFYVRCLTYYGLIAAVLYFLPYLLIKKDTNMEAKKMSIISAIHLLLESATVNMSIIPIYLIMADAIMNKDDDIEQSKHA